MLFNAFSSSNSHRTLGAVSANKEKSLCPRNSWMIFFFQNSTYFLYISVFLFVFGFKTSCFGFKNGLFWISKRIVLDLKTGSTMVIRDYSSDCASGVGWLRRFNSSALDLVELPDASSVCDHFIDVLQEFLIVVYCLILTFTAVFSTVNVYDGTL